MDCDQTREHLSAFLDGELPDEAGDGVRAHLAACPACRADLEELHATANLLGRLPLRPAPADLAESIERAIARRALRADSAAGAGRPSSDRLRHGSGPWSQVLALAASVLLAVGIGALIWLEGVEPRRPVALDAREQGRERAEPAAPRPAPPPPETVLAMKRAADAAEKAPAAPGATPAPAAGEVPPVALLKEGDDPLAYVANGTLDASGRTGESPKALAPTGSAKNGTDDDLFAGGGQALTPSAAFDLDDDRERVTPSAAGKSAAGTDLRIGGGSLRGELRLGVAAAEEEKQLEAGPAAPDEDRPAEEGENLFGTFTVLPAEEPALPAPNSTVAVLPDRAAEVQHQMDRVARGRTPLEALEHVAMGGNLARADRQLILRAPSHEAGRRRLLGLFEAAGWAPLARPGVEDERVASPSGRRGQMAQTPGATDERAPQEGREAAPAAGYYFRTEADAGETWLVLTDLEGLSAFGSQLARTADLAVAYSSSREFAPIRHLQDRLRTVTAEAGSGQAGPTVASTGQGAGRGGPVDTGAGGGGARPGQPAGRRLGERDAGRGSRPEPRAAAATSAAPVAEGHGERLAEQSPAAQRLAAAGEDHRGPETERMADAGKVGTRADRGDRKPDEAGKGAEPRKKAAPVADRAKEAVEESAAREGFFLWSDGALRHVAPPPEDQVLLVIRVRAETPSDVTGAETTGAAPRPTGPTETSAPAGAIP